MGIKDGDGNPIGLMPNTLLCSPTNYITARAIYQSDIITGAASKQGRDNVMRGILNPNTSPYLQANGTAYWLYNSAFPLVDVAFLGGRQAPVVETANVDFNQLGILMRCYFDYGASKGETKAALYSTGA